MEVDFNLEDDVVVIAVCTDFADAVTLDADVRGVANLRFNSRLSFVSNENLVTGIAADIGRGAVERDDLSAELVPPESTVRNPICSIRRKHLRLGCANGDHTGFNGTREADLDMFGAVTRDQSIIQAFLIVRPNGKTAVLHIGDGGLCPNAVYTSMTGRWMRGLHIGQGDVADRFVAVKS